MPNTCQRYYFANPNIKPCCREKVEGQLERYVSSTWENLTIHAGFLQVDIDPTAMQLYDSSYSTVLPNGWRIVMSPDEIPAERVKQQWIFLRRALYLALLAVVVSVLEWYRVALLGSAWATLLFTVIGILSLGVISVGIYRHIEAALISWRHGGNFLDSVMALLICILFAFCCISMHGAMITGCAVCLAHFQCTLWLLAVLQVREWLRIALPSYLEPEAPQTPVFVGVEANKGDIILVKSGQTIACSAALVSNQAALFDTVVTDGETNKSIQPGGIIPYGATFIGDGQVRVKVDTPLPNRQVNIQQALAARAVRRRALASNYLAVFVAVIVVISVLAPMVWWLLTPGFQLVTAANMMLSICLIACPCALSIVQPLLYSMASAKMITMRAIVRYNMVWCHLIDLDPSQVVFCWDRTNTLTDPGSTDAASLRGEVPMVINGLRDMGYTQHYVLSGSTVSCPEAMFKDYPFTAYQYGLSASGKSDFVNSKQNAGQYVIMIGDGANDVLALLQADIAIAVRHGNGTAGRQCSTKPAEYADLVVTNTLQGVLAVMQMVRWLRPIQGALLSGNMLYNLVAVALAAGGLWWMFGIQLAASWAGLMMCFSMVMSVTMVAVAVQAVPIKPMDATPSVDCCSGDKGSSSGTKISMINVENKKNYNTIT